MSISHEDIGENLRRIVISGRLDIPGTDEIAAKLAALSNAPKKGAFRLMPPRAVAEAVWAAYGSDKLHWNVPPEIAWIDRIKGFAPELMRKRIKKTVRGITGDV